MDDFRSYISLILNGKSYSKNELILHSNKVLNSEKEDWEKAIFSFILEWLNDDDFITVFTSGSTGKPKAIKLQKSALIFSAKNTLNYLKIKTNDSAFLCIPANYIGGKMMVVRSFVGKLNLSYTKPTSTPFINLKTNVNLTAITPFQANKSSKKNLDKINTIIIGGGNISSLLTRELTNIKSSFYSSYGMTETCSHIALKNISTGENEFTVLDNISIALDERQCLTINAPDLSKEIIKTNDVVELISKNTFVWKGRFDNVINSGGIKLYPEEIEAKISPFISERFFITKEEDDLLGEKMLLVIESEQKIVLDFPPGLLTKYEVPRHVYFIPKFIETATGKIQRKKTLEQ